MRKSFAEQDKSWQEWQITLPLVMGYNDGEPVVSISGAGGPFHVPEETFKRLAVQVLRSYGFLVIPPEEIHFTRKAEP